MIRYLMDKAPYEPDNYMSGKISSESTNFFKGIAIGLAISIPLWIILLWWLKVI